MHLLDGEAVAATLRFRGSDGITHEKHRVSALTWCHYVSTTMTFVNYANYEVIRDSALTTCVACLAAQWRRPNP